MEKFDFEQTHGTKKEENDVQEKEPSVEPVVLHENEEQTADPSRKEIQESRDGVIIRSYTKGQEQ